MVCRVSRVVPVAMIVAALGAGACGSSSDKKVSSDEKPSTSATSISIKNFAFAPPTLQAKVGSTVTATNDDSAAHTVVADDKSFDSGDIAAKTSKTFTVTKAGTVKYHCGIHNYMTGVIEVTA